VITNRFPAGSFYVSSIPVAAPSGANELVLPLGNIASGASTFATVTVKLGAAGSYTNEAVVKSLLADPDASNNSVVTRLAAADSTPPTLTIALAAAGSIRLTWPATAASFQLQSRDSLSTGGWSLDPAQTVEDSGDLTATIPIDTSTRFYRLARP